MNETLPAIPVAANPAVTRASFIDMSPAQMVAFGTEIANALCPVVDNRKLYSMINGRKYVNVEAWTTMGAMLGITARERDVKYVDGDYEAYVDLIATRTGAVVGGASSICGNSDPVWAGRPKYAQRSMAITRATGKAFRLSYSWIMKLAGYEPTPAEEMELVQRFNAKEKHDIDWLKAQPQVALMDETSIKKVALALHGLHRLDLDTVIERLESQSRQSAGS